MAEPSPDTLSSQAYRHGYREGFRDAQAQPKPGGTDHPEDSSSADQSKPEDKRSDDSKSDDKKPPFYKRPLIALAIFVVVLALVVGGIFWWRHSRHHETTDDAFIDGYATSIAAQIGGRVTRLLVNDNQLVHAGDLLLEIDARDADAKAAQARAQLANAESELESARAQVEVRRAAAQQATAGTRQEAADLAKAEQDLDRYRRVDPDAVPRQQVDAAATQAQTAHARIDASHGSERSARAQIAAALAQVRTGEAGVAAARAAVEAAELQVSYTRVVAPIDGHVTHRSIDVGNVVAAGQPLLAVVANTLWVTANYKETQLARVRPGLSVEVTVDAYPDTHFRAHVDSIQRGTGAYFSMLPAENATGNYVKVTQRVPVKIVFDDDRVRNYAIGPGMSVTPDVAVP